MGITKRLPTYSTFQELTRSAERYRTIEIFNIFSIDLLECNWYSPLKLQLQRSQANAFSVIVTSGHAGWCHQIIIKHLSKCCHKAKSSPITCTSQIIRHFSPLWGRKVKIIASCWVQLNGLFTLFYYLLLGYSVHVFFQCKTNPDEHDIPYLSEGKQLIWCCFSIHFSAALSSSAGFGTDLVTWTVMYVFVGVFIRLQYTYLSTFKSYGINHFVSARKFRRTSSIPYRLFKNGSLNRSRGKNVFKADISNIT